MKKLLLLVIACTLSPATAARAQDKAKKRPNVIIILADDMGYADAGFQGCKDIPTPNIDALAKNGVRFTSGYVSGPYCSPTRAGLMTGRYQTRFGHEFNPAGGKQGMPIDQTTIAQRFRALGYLTALIGKWHLGNETKMHPTERGFQDYCGFLGGAHPYFGGSASGMRGGAVSHISLISSGVRPYAAFTRSLTVRSSSSASAASVCSGTTAAVCSPFNCFIPATVSGLARPRAFRTSPVRASASSRATSCNRCDGFSMPNSSRSQSSIARRPDCCSAVMSSGIST